MTRRYNKETDKLEPSTVVFYDKDLSQLSKLIFVIFRSLRFIRVTETIEDDDHKTENNLDKKTQTKGSKKIRYESSNFTIINFYLVWMGPTREDNLTFSLLVIQVIFIGYVGTLCFKLRFFILIT